MDSLAFYLFLFSLGAFFVPIISRKLFLPVIVGEILFGMLLSFFFYRDNLDLQFIEYLSQMGFIFLMFLAGMELNFDNFDFKNIRTPILLAILFFLSAFLIWRYVLKGEEIFLMIILGATSVGIVFLVLKTKGVEQSHYGQSLIWAASIGELISIVLLIFYEVWHKYEKQFNPEFIVDISGLIGLLVGAYVLIKLIMLFLWRFPKVVHALNEGPHHDMSELSVRLAFLVLLTMVALTSLFDLELILGAFLGGMMLSFVFRDKSLFEEKLSSIGYGFFIPFFFMKLGWDFGMQTDNFQKILIMALQFYGAIFLIRLLPSLVLIFPIRFSGFLKSLRNSISASFLWSAPLTLLIAFGKLGYDLEILDSIIYRSLILCAMLGAVLAPFGFSLFYSHSEQDHSSSIEKK